ncbi:hypothetical protein BH09SUM1_BH09SUM1_15910 [soil metagenome]
MRKLICTLATMLIVGPAFAFSPIASWTTQATILPNAANQAGLTLQGSDLYFVGGQDEVGDTDKVWRFPVNAGTGALDAAVATTALPALNNFAYVFEQVSSTSTTVYVAGGGWNTAVPTLWDRVHYAPINAGGQLGAWTASSTFPASYKLQLGGSVVANGFIYVFAGNDDSGAGVLFNNVYYAALGAGGAPGAWQTGTVLPQACWFTGSTVVGNYLVVNPGLTGAGNTTTTDLIYTAPINPTTGAVGAWTTQAVPLPAQRYNLNLSTVGNTIFAIGGRASGGTAVDSVWMADFNTTTGILGVWNTSSAVLPATIRYHDVAYSPATNRLYVLATGNQAFISSPLTTASGAQSWSAYN